MIGTMKSEYIKQTVADPPPEEAMDFSALPDPAERQETVKRANQALKRARTLLEHIDQLEHGKISSALDTGPASRST
jgi:hypothetical protein